MGKLYPQGLKGLIEKPDRYPDGQGLFFKTLGQGRAYWTYRFRSGGKERETSLGPYPETTLEQARIKHAELRAMVLKGIDPVADGRNAKAAVAAKADVPTFGTMADQYIAAHEAGWRNPKHRWQWAQTLTTYAAPIRNLPVDQIDAKAVLRVLEPIWTATPETASRLRGRIEAILASAQVAGWIDPDKPNPARWKNWLDHTLPPPKKLGVRGHHAAMPYADLPAFWAKLAEINTVAAKALMFTILCASRTSETINAVWDEVSFADSLWRVPKERMKMGVAHDVPLSEEALTILGDQLAGLGKNVHVFPGGLPKKPLSSMAMAMLMRRMGAGEFTVHGMRSAFRVWAGENGVEFETAERCLAHSVGNEASQSYNRTTLLDRRRPVMQAWADHVTGKADANVVPISKPRIRAPYRRA
jgi:integrase